MPHDQSPLNLDDITHTPIDGKIDGKVFRRCAASKDFTKHCLDFLGSTVNICRLHHVGHSQDEVRGFWRTVLEAARKHNVPLHGPAEALAKGFGL